MAKKSNYWVRDMPGFLGRGSRTAQPGCSGNGMGGLGCEDMALAAGSEMEYSRKQLLIVDF